MDTGVRTTHHPTAEHPQPYKVYPLRSELTLDHRSSSPEGDGGMKKPKRRAKIRACDACAIRKTRCEEKRPCQHCVNNNLECTLLRERKKLGPKKLRKKTLDTINSIKAHPDIVSSLARPTSRKAHLASAIPLANGSGAAASPNDLITPTVLVEILHLANHPSMVRVLRSLTIPLYLKSVPELATFVRINFPGPHADVPVSHESDPVFLLKFMGVLTLCLLIIENIVKFNYFNYQNFQIFNNDIFKLKNFVFFLQNKIIDTYALLNRVLIFPHNIENTLQIHHFHVNYNRSVSSLHLYNYYQITSSLNNNQQYKDQQKLVYLRQAITHYQLISLPYKSDVMLIQLYELYEQLFVHERLNHLLDNVLFVRDNNLILNKWNLAAVSIIPGDDNSLYKLLVDASEGRLFSTESTVILLKFLDFNVKAQLGTNKPSHYKVLAARLLLQTESTHSIETSMVDVIQHVLLFKSLLTYSGDFDLTSFKAALADILVNLNEMFKNLLQLCNIETDSKEDSTILKVQLSNYQLIPHLLQMVKVYLDCGDDVSKDDTIVTFSNHLTQYFLTYPISNKLIRSDPMLDKWFNTLNKINFENQTFLNNLLDDLEKSVKNIASRTPQDMAMAQRARSTPYARGGSFENAAASEDEKSDDDEGFLQLPHKPSLAKPPPKPLTKKESFILPPLPLTPVISNGNFLPRNSSSLSSFLPMHNAELKEEDANQISLSESTKNLYNLFNQITDDVPNSNSNSLTNLLQFPASGVQPPSSKEQFFLL